MKKDPAVLFYISDWLTSTSEMDADVRGWYLNLLLHNYDKGSLPNDIEKLAVLAGVKFSEYKRFEQVFEQVFKQKFEQTPEQRLSNPRTNEILRQRENFKEKRSESGKLSYFLKFCRAKYSKSMTKDFIEFVKDNIDFTDIDLKSEHMLEHLFKHLFELYRNRNRNRNENIDVIKDKDIELVNSLNLQNPEFEEVFVIWLRYKRSKGQAYKNKDSCTIAFKKLYELSGGNIQKAKDIIEQSIANNYAGLFELKQQKPTSSNSNDDRREKLQKLQQNTLDLLKYASNS
jgi:uncharacterized protein YdaU (DUF1376 family)